MFKTSWRLPDYNFGCLVIFALLSAFTFFHLGDSVDDLQSCVFVTFQVFGTKSNQPWLFFNSFSIFLLIFLLAPVIPPVVCPS